MKDFLSQAEYLQSKGYTKESSKEDLVEAKKVYRRLYLRAYRKHKKESIKRLTVRLDIATHDRLQTHKQAHGVSSLSEFIVSSSLAYLDQTYLMPNVQEQTKLLKEIQRIGTNINQVVSKLHQQLRYTTMRGTWDDSVKNMAKILVGYELLIEQVESLKTQVHEYINSPPPALTGLAWETIRHDLIKLKQVIRFLMEHLDETSSPNPIKK